ncbi:MAG: cyanophycinase [Gemmatimonadales bacterium]|nr:cyanophycinase [Gemmatimonadales bacterium]MYC89251.1 cyanophycinase [Candidatus Palauibacter denitrificans]
MRTERRAWGVFRVLRTVAVAACAAASMTPAKARAQEVGPPNGSLVVVGGAMRSPEIANRFVQLAGGTDARIVVIPTAGGAESYGPSFGGVRPFQAAGVEHLTVRHTNDRDEANSEAFVAAIREATGVWFTGGRQWRLVDSYAGTRTEDELWALLERGGVIGGSSAGATIQGSYLARGDTATNTIMMGSHEEGFGFLRNTAVDQHLLYRNRHFDLLEIIEARPELLGIGIDENTAIVVQGDRFEVIGESYVVIYDNQSTLDSGGLFYFLAPGDQYDLATRRAYRPSRGLQPLGRVEGRPWPRRQPDR